jgi:phasin
MTTLPATSGERVGTPIATFKGAIMVANIKTGTTTDAKEQLRDLAERSAAESKKAHDKMSAASGEAANVMQNIFSSALNGMQGYNSKFMEFTQANATTAADFAQRLSGVKSPSEFIALWTEFTQQQLPTMANQTKVLAELAQKVMLTAAEPLRKG